MFRLSLAVVPETKKEVMEYRLTSDDLENFYRVIVKFLFMPDHPSSSFLAIFRKNFLLFLQNELNSGFQQSFSLAQKNILITQLKNNDFFKDKIDLKIITAILELLHGNHKLKEIVKPEDCEEFFRNLSNIYDLAQQSNYPDAKATCPANLSSASSLSAAERNGLTYHAAYQTSNPACELQSIGIKHYNNKEWQQAIYYFEAAINAEEQMTVECQKETNTQLIAIFRRWNALAYNGFALEFYAKKDYRQAAKFLNFAIAESNKIDEPLRIRRDNESLVCYQRSLVSALNLLGNEFHSKKAFADAVDCYQAVIDEFAKINSSYITEADESNSVVFCRNLANSAQQLGNENYFAGKFDQALKFLKLSVLVFEKISGNKTEADESTYANCHRFLAYTYNGIGLKNHYHQNRTQAMQNYQLAMREVTSIIPKYISATDRAMRKTYQDNFNHAMAENEAEYSRANNSQQFFYRRTLKSQRNQPEYEPRACKRRKLN